MVGELLVGKLLVVWQAWHLAWQRRARGLQVMLSYAAGGCASGEGGLWLEGCIGAGWGSRGS